MKLLIVKLSAFGDIIHALPALDDLLAKPEVSEIHWLVDARYYFVTELLPKAVTVHAVALKSEHPIASAWHAIRQLRHVGFDAVLDMQGLIKSAALARLAGSPVYGMDKAQMREAAGSLLVRPVAFHAEERHVVQMYRRVAAAPFTGAARPESPIPYAPPRIDLAATRIAPASGILNQFGLVGDRYVVLHSAGGWETKHLPEQSWLAIARALSDLGQRAIFSWGNDSERQQAENLARQCNGFALPERLDMSKLCALLQDARAVVGADTGLLHLAAALATPTITFWGPSASWRSAPLGERDWQIESNPACGPCFKRRCDHFICMDAIDADSIIRNLHEI